MMLRVVAVACLVTFVALDSAWAQSQSDRPPVEMASRLDARIMEALGNGKFGAVVLDVETINNGRLARCDEHEITVARQVNGRWQTSTIRGRTHIVLVGALQTSQGGIGALAPGDYVVASTLCKSGRNRSTMQGPYAAFQVKAGEVVNIGVLRLEFDDDILFGTIKGKLKKSISGMTPEARAKLKEEFPRTFPKAIERRMTMVGPPEVEIQKRSNSLF